MFVMAAIVFVFALTLIYRTVRHEIELAKLKADFVSTVSHEFKSPITSIRQLAELLQAGRIPTGERCQQYFNVIVEQSERLSTLVDNILDFSRMEEGRSLFRFETLDLVPLLRDVTQRMQHQVAYGGFMLEVQIEASLPPIRGDKLAVAQAVHNVLDNAVKYSGEERWAALHARLDGNTVCIEVHDHGPGIPRHEQKKIFDKFYRGGDPVTRTVRGTGLGLTLVRQIMDAHQGEIQVASQPGTGTTFTLRFPVVQG
jgi:signal transduction histidine kinase